MPNNLTGDFEAVLQISVRQLNAILATMHQRGVDPAASPSFDHTGSLSIGEPRFTNDSAQFQTWFQSMTATLASSSLSLGNPRTLFSLSVPPGASLFIQSAFTGLDAAFFPPVEGVGVKGIADFQVSTPTISFPTGVVSEVRVHVDVRANYLPERGSEALPAPIHGAIEAVYRLTVKTGGVGQRPVLSVRVSPNDNQIQFISAPSAGLSAAEVNAISVQVRKVLRKQFVPVDVQLPEGFAFAEFKALGAGPTEAVVLPLRLSAGPVPAGVASLTNHFLGANEFAIAVSQTYVQTFLDQFIDKIRKSVADIRITASFLGIPTAHYTASLSSSSVVWKNGSIEISGRIELVTGSIAPNGFITFKQSIGLVVDVPSQTVSARPLGEPDVDESWWLPHSRAVNEVRSARDNGMVQATASVNKTFADARNKLLSAVRSFDVATATVAYTALDVSPDGIVLRGAIGTSGRLAPVVDFREVVTAAGPVFTALNSWIPGGWIERYKWSWQDGLAWNAAIRTHETSDSFLIPTPRSIANTGRICLEIQGTRVSPDGQVEPVIAGDTCGPSWTEPILTLPPWAFEANVPVWIPRFPDRPLSDAVAGHLNIVAGLRTPNSLGPNTLVHFAGSSMERPLEGLSQALSETRLGDHSLTTIVVLPEGTLDNHPSKVDATLGAVGKPFASNNLLITEDFRGGWTKIFAAADGPSTHLVNARGEFAWSQAGALDASALGAALDKHLVPAPGARTAPLRLTVRPGAQMPDTNFIDDQGNQTALRRLRGQNVLLAFWKSWSAPCIEQLRRLQQLQDQEHPPIILAINGGEDRTVLADVRYRNSLTFPLIHDPLQSIATTYGVQCWPTTVSINREGIVDQVKFGLTYAYSNGGSPQVYEPASQG